MIFGAQRNKADCQPTAAPCAYNPLVSSDTFRVSVRAWVRAMVMVMVTARARVSARMRVRVRGMVMVRATMRVRVIASPGPPLAHTTPLPRPTP